MLTSIGNDLNDTEDEKYETYMYQNIYWSVEGSWTDINDSIDPSSDIKENTHQDNKQDSPNEEGCCILC